MAGRKRRAPRVKLPEVKKVTKTVALSSDQVQTAIWEYLLRRNLCESKKGVFWELSWSNVLGGTPSLTARVTNVVDP